MFLTALDADVGKRHMAAFDIPRKGEVTY